MIFFFLLELPIESRFQYHSQKPLELISQDTAPVSDNVVDKSASFQLDDSLEESGDDSAALEVDMSLEAVSKQVPVVLDGSVDHFDPIARAAELATTLPRIWCGTYTPFGRGSDQKVRFELSQVASIGQMVDLRGQMTIGSITSQVQGNWNAKSDQLDLVPLSKKLTNGFESGGKFVGLQGIKLLSWESTIFADPGGRLDMDTNCPVNK